MSENSSLLALRFRGGSLISSLDTSRLELGGLGLLSSDDGVRLGNGYEERF